MVYRKTAKTREATINLRVTSDCRKRLEELAYKWSEPGNTCHMVDALERSIDLAYASDKTKLRRVK